MTRPIGIHRRVMKAYDKSTVKSSIGDDLSSWLDRGWMWLLAGLMAAQDVALEDLRAIRRNRLAVFRAAVHAARA